MTSKFRKIRLVILEILKNASKIYKKILCNANNAA